jgi:histidine triad (HIT) family protein
MVECVFCSIASETNRSTTVYEDCDVISFMDRNPINPGHVLVIPKTHVANIQDLDEQIYLHVMLIAKKIAMVIDTLYSPAKVGFSVAGFDVPHAHLHIIPLRNYHDLTSKHYLDGTLKKPEATELEDEAARIRLKM